MAPLSVLVGAHSSRCIRYATFFSASFVGIGGECGPTDTAWLGSPLLSVNINEDSDICGVALELVVVVLADEAVENVAMPNSALESGMLPNACIYVDTTFVCIVDASDSVCIYFLTLYTS